MNQKTIKNMVRASGTGAHSGLRVGVVLRPAEENVGIVFKRTHCKDEQGNAIPDVLIPALSEYVTETVLSTTIARDGQRVATVEHFLSAVSGLGIDNLLVDVDGPELPIMDGSASPFVFLIQSAGIQLQGAKRRYLRVKKRILVEEKGGWASLEPYDRFKVSYTLSYSHPVLEHCSNREVSVEVDEVSYLKSVSRARTFGFLSDYAWLKEKNLALGANLDNTVVLDEAGVVNEEGLRDPDEFVRHKILDAIGDLFLVGAPLLGWFRGYKSGHTLNNRLVRMLFQDPTAWEWVDPSAALYRQQRQVC